VKVKKQKSKGKIVGVRDQGLETKYWAEQANHINLCNLWLKNVRAIRGIRG